jgi:hypothetical protein
MMITRLNKDKCINFVINRMIWILQIYFKLTNINNLINKANLISKTQVYSSKKYAINPQTP